MTVEVDNGVLPAFKLETNQVGNNHIITVRIDLGANGSADPAIGVLPVSVPGQVLAEVINVDEFPVGNGAICPFPEIGTKQDSSITKVDISYPDAYTIVLAYKNDLDEVKATKTITSDVNGNPTNISWS